MKTFSFPLATAMAAMAADVPLAFASGRKHGSNNGPSRRPARMRRRAHNIAAPSPASNNLFMTAKSGKAGSSKSSKSSSNNSSVGFGLAKSSKSEGAKAGKAAVHYVNIFTDPYPILLITNAPTPQPTLTPALNQTESIITSIAVNENSCTGAPCAEEGWCRSPRGTCGSGGIYCNNRASWTALCPSWAPSKDPTKVEKGGPMDPTGGPTAFMTTFAPIDVAVDNRMVPTSAPMATTEATTTLAPIVAGESATEPTSAPMVESLPTTTTEPPVNNSLRGDTVNLEAVEGVGIDNNFLQGEGVETSDNNLQGVQEQDNPLPSVVTVRTDDGSSNGEDGGSGGFPALGYAAIGLGAALAVGAGVILKTELSQRGLSSSE